MDNTPNGANEDRRAPWHDIGIHEDFFEEVEITVSVTLSKTIKTKVPSYKKDDDAYLRRHVQSEMVLPQDAHHYFGDSISSNSRESIQSDLEGWVVDDFEVIIED